MRCANELGRFCCCKDYNESWLWFFKFFFPKSSVIDLDLILPRLLSLTVAHSRCPGIRLGTSSKPSLAYSQLPRNLRFRVFLLSLCSKGPFHLALAESAAGSAPQSVRLCLCWQKPSETPAQPSRQSAAEEGGEAGSSSCWVTVQLPGMEFLNPGPRALNFLLAII